MPPLWSIKTHNVVDEWYAAFFALGIAQQIRKPVADIFIGGGITKDSDPEKEWDETVAKSNVMKKVL